jgi:hypothetical protein
MNRSHSQRLSYLWIPLGIAVATNSYGTNSETAPSKILEKCGVLFEADSGEIKNQILPTLHVAALDQHAEFSLPSEVPARVRGIMCGRESIVPLANDYKVLLAGYTFNIVAGERVGVLEISGGQLRFRMIDGKMSDEEAASMQEFLNVSQPFFDAPDNSTDAAANHESTP